MRGTTKVAGIIGWPVDHSLSPTIHNAAFQALGLDWVYVPLPVRPGEVDEALAGMRALGLAGANVTMPHKRDAMRACSELSEDAKLTGAVNTLLTGAEGFAGHNTDVGGFQRFLERDAGFDASGKRALVFGAGGAAGAVLLALARAGIAEVTMAVRDVDRGRNFAAGLRDSLDKVHVLSWEKARDVRPDLVVNASPARQVPAPTPSPDMFVVDLVYRPAETSLVRFARQHGATAFGGLGMLLHQAALSFEIWTGQPAPIEVMSAAALAELAETPN
jgi:shikimate dehydrogenase